MFEEYHRLRKRANQMNDDAVDNKAEQATDATKHSVAPGGSKNSTSGAAAS